MSRLTPAQLASAVQQELARHGVAPADLSWYLTQAFYKLAEKQSDKSVTFSHARRGHLRSV